MMVDRRSARRNQIQFFMNQYIDGVPYLSEGLELSMSGALVRRVLSPNADRACYALEIGLPEQADQRVFVCATPVWRSGPFEALRFVAQSLSDRLRLANVIARRI
ncbi:MAG: hypothetical protein HOV80_32045 [Polyangiaceae bacterium]|nr:hypothetical protein [Polyangiaceae bacterium]